MATSTKPACRLLELPPELRNRIYRLVSRSDEHIPVHTTGHTRPALLSTCHRIRRESLAIFYGENKFYLLIRNYDDTACHRFRTSLPTLPTFPRFTLSPNFGVGRGWENLLLWLQRFHKRQSVSMLRPESLADRRKRKPGRLDFGLDVWVISGMFSTVRRLRKLPWNEVKVIVEEQRPLLERFSKQWAAEGPANA